MVQTRRYLGGQAIQTNGINFADSKDRRSIARWEYALKQLQTEKPVMERKYKGESFEMTTKWYLVADELLQKTS